jgi:hypothetical protein
MSEVVWKDTGWSQAVQTATKLGTIEVRAGVVGAKAEEPNGEEGRVTNGEAAILNEYGTDDGHIPARAPIQRTFERDGGKVQSFFAAAVSRAIAGIASPEAALRDVGDWAVSEIRKTIAQGVPPPNAPATIARKGSSHPLIDTGDMYNAVGYEIGATRTGPTLDEGHEAFELSGMSQAPAEVGEGGE